MTANSYRRLVGPATKPELTYTRSIRRESGLAMLDEGRAELVSPREYRAPLRRFLQRERTMVHVRLTASARKQLEARSRKTGLAPEVLVRQWIDERHRRNAG